MSIGNTKTQGNKGNNFPYQLRSLQLLGEIAASLTSTLTGIERIPQVIETSGSGDFTSIPRIYNISFYNASTVDGFVTVNTVPVTLTAGMTINYDPGVNNYYDGKNFSYDATGSAMVITLTI